MDSSAEPGTRVPLVRIVDLHKRYGDREVLRGITLDVDAGSTVAVIGPSGGGKSTLLRCINYLERPTSGEIFLDGEQVGVIERGGRRRRASEHALARTRRSIGMVFQSFNLFPHMTVLDNVALPQMRSLGTPARLAKDSALQLLDRVGLAGHADEYPNRCSGGQQQRVAIARALALRPRVMLFDEPTSSLDPELGLEVLTVMRQLAADGMTMLVATHEMNFAHDVADRVVFLDNGRVVEAGSPAEVLRDPKEPRTRQFLRAVLDR
jgi:polar amino acid transport system ATP-binding protein